MLLKLIITKKIFSLLFLFSLMPFALNEKSVQVTALRKLDTLNEWKSYQFVSSSMVSSQWSIKTCHSKMIYRKLPSLLLLVSGLWIARLEDGQERSPLAVDDPSAVLRCRCLQGPEPADHRGLLSLPS